MAGRASLVVEEAERGARLDQFVQRAFSRGPAAPTRGEVQRWISLGAVSVNGSARKPSEALRLGDVVVVDRPDAPRTDATPDATVVFDVVYEDEALIVVNKPAGLVVHPARSHPAGTLVNGLLARGFFDASGTASVGAGMSDVGDAEGHYRPGIVHRIDKGTSGLLVVARTPAAREGLKLQLSSHTVLREYDAIAIGDVKRTEHDTLHGRHPTDRLRFTTRVREGKRAITYVEVVRRFASATHVRCTLRTGRTHQIRVHLAETGTPVLGDPLYGRSKPNEEITRFGMTLGHQALHARLLGFTHPITGAPLVFEAPLPDDFVAALEWLGTAPAVAPGKGRRH